MSSRKYSDKEKAAYYKKKARSAERAVISGRGRYKIGRPYIRGRGAYKFPKNFFSAPKIGGILGGAGGAAIGNMLAPGIGGKLGASLGAELGSGAGSLFKSLTGWGDYNIKENSLLFPDHVVPSFGEDSIRVRKREYISDIDATTAFTNNSFPINPGLSDTFPWLSSIANNFDQYRFNGLVFQFVSTSSDAIASTTDLGLGQVILASDYNSADAAYVNAPQMLGSMFSNSGKPSENIMHAIECASPDQAQKLYYVRSGDVPTGADIRLYDIASFQLATQKMPAEYDGAGQLWVSYDVTFCKSVMNNQLGYDINTDKWIITAPTGTDPFGNGEANRSLVDHSNLGATLTDDTIFFPVTLGSGYYLVVYKATGASTACTAPTITVSECTLVSAWTNDTATSISDGGSTVTQFIQFMIVRLDSQGAFLQLTSGTLPGTPTFGDLIVTQINGEMFV